MPGIHCPPGSAHTTHWVGCAGSQQTWWGGCKGPIWLSDLWASWKPHPDGLGGFLLLHSCSKEASPVQAGG